MIGTAARKEYVCVSLRNRLACSTCLLRCMLMLPILFCKTKSERTHQTFLFVVYYAGYIQEMPNLDLSYVPTADVYVILSRDPGSDCDSLRIACHTFSVTVMTVL